MKLLQKVFFYALLWGLVGAVSLVCLEVSLRLIDRVDSSLLPGVRFQYEEGFGPRNRANIADHDGRGYRNAGAVEQACAVVLGDSQNYGTGVRADAPWPAQLSAMTGQEIYSMSTPGWGVWHQLQVIDQALALQPSVVFTSFYSGNDLHDASVQFPDQALANSNSVGRGSAGGLKAWIKGTESWSRVSQLVFELYRYSPLAGIDKISRPQPLSCESGDAVPLRGMREVCLNNAQVQDVLQISWRLAVMNDLQVSSNTMASDFVLGNLIKLHKRIRKNDSSNVVLLIPVKESVYAAAFPEETERFTGLVELVQREEDLFSKIRTYLTAQNIDFIDVKKILADALRTEGVENIYLFADGHLSAQGHQILANALQEKVHPQFCPQN